MGSRENLGTLFPTVHCTLTPLQTQRPRLALVYPSKIDTKIIEIKIRILLCETGITNRSLGSSFSAVASWPAQPYLKMAKVNNRAAQVRKSKARLREVTTRTAPITRMIKIGTSNKYEMIWAIEVNRYSTYL